MSLRLNILTSVDSIIIENLEKIHESNCSSKDALESFLLICTLIACDAIIKLSHVLSFQREVLTLSHVLPLMLQAETSPFHQPSHVKALQFVDMMNMSSRIKYLKALRSS